MCVLRTPDVVQTNTFGLAFERFKTAGSFGSSRVPSSTSVRPLQHPRHIERQTSACNQKRRQAAPLSSSTIFTSSFGPCCCWPRAAQSRHLLRQHHASLSQQLHLWSRGPSCSGTSASASGSSKDTPSSAEVAYCPPDIFTGKSESSSEKRAAPDKDKQQPGTPVTDAAAPEDSNQQKGDQPSSQEQRQPLVKSFHLVSAFLI